MRLLAGTIPLPATLPLADTAAVRTPGRVQSLGRFASEAATAPLAAALPAALAAALRPTFEWYACRGAFFHNDAHYGEVLFGAWCAAGPAREIVFPRGGLRVAATPGAWAVFDPFEPHAVLDAGRTRYARADYADGAVSLFIGFELSLDDAVRAAFGIGAARPGAPLLASSVAVHPETGAA